MTTGIVGAFTNGTLTYTAPVDAKLIVSSAGNINGSIPPVTINGIVAVIFTTATNVSLSHFIGAGQTVTIAAPGGANCVVSVIEGA